jgi:predicted transcriptional regulator/DNA-binding XRE family transcriptional regulator
MEKQPLDEQMIRAIFGLKVRQLREQSGLSLFGLSKKTGLSKSYLNEIEKGKKYPKTDKIILLGEALEINYEELVSLKLTGTMAPVADILRSGVLKEIPLHMFGIQESDLLSIIASAPEKTAAFISTLFEMARTFEMTRENFYLAALRSLQELNHNYFEDLEIAVNVFRKRYGFDLEQLPLTKEMEAILKEEFDYQLEKGMDKAPDLPEIRSVFAKGKKPVLWISDSVSEGQRRFILAKELAYAFLNLSERPHTFTWIHFNTFDEVYNNFKASYFAGALLLPEKALTVSLKRFMEQKNWDPEVLLQMINNFSDSPETFFQRLTNLFPGVFGLHDLFFIRFRKSATGDLVLDKELHLNKYHRPHAHKPNEHYCRRWLSVSIFGKHSRTANRPEAQISVYPDGVAYLVMAIRQKETRFDGERSIAIGIELNAQTKKKLKFTTNPNLPTQKVGVTCETCNIQNCEVRQSPPIQLELVQRDQEIRNRVSAFQKSLTHQS